MINVFPQRYVPFMAVASANLVNIPLMRQSELVEGALIRDPGTGEAVANSKVKKKLL